MNNHKTLCRVGMSFLILALLSLRFLGNTDLADGAKGLLMGLSIGFNLWSVSVKTRQKSC